MKVNIKSQKGRILNLLRERGEQGVKVYELIAPRPEGLGVAQYNSRIYDLRHLGYNIVNTDDKFVLVNEPEKPQYIFNPETQSYEVR